MIKKLASILMSMFIIIGLFPIESLASRNDFKEVVNNQSKELNLNYEVEDYKLNENDISSLDAVLDHNGYYSHIENDGFNEIKNSKLSPVLVKTKNKEKGIIIPLTYENEEYYLYTQIVYSPEFNCILSMNSTKIHKETGDNSEYFSYSDAKYLRELRYSLPKFICDMGGALACATYCGGIGLAFPVAGFTCSVICGPAFGYACDKA